MYIIKKLDTNKRYGKKQFATYEEARSYVRRMLRKMHKAAMLLYYRSNPNIVDFGYQVVRKCAHI